MANHTDDCPHCGQDRRNAGDHCCATNMERVRDGEIAFSAEQSRRQALFDGFGISYYRDSSGAVLPHIKAVVALLDNLSFAENARVGFVVPGNASKGTGSTFDQWFEALCNFVAEHTRKYLAEDCDKESFRESFDEGMTAAEAFLEERESWD